MGHLEKMQEIDFLGAEFLTWLAVESASERGPEDWGDCRPASIMVSGPVVLEGMGHGARQVSVRGDDVLQVQEFRAALAVGKGIRRIKIAVATDEDEWEGTLDAKTLEWRGARVDAPTVADAAEFAHIRTQAFERLTRLLDEWFAAFLKRRMDEHTWDKEIEKIRAFAGESL